MIRFFKTNIYAAPVAVVAANVAVTVAARMVGKDAFEREKANMQPFCMFGYVSHRQSKRSSSEGMSRISMNPIDAHAMHTSSSVADCRPF